MSDAIAVRDGRRIEGLFWLGLGTDCWPCGILVQLLDLDCHVVHEEAAQSVQWQKCREAVPALERLALKRHRYRSMYQDRYDDNGVLARRCTWALADIGTSEARAALERLAKTPDTQIAAIAERRLANWDAELPRKGPT